MFFAPPGHTNANQYPGDNMHVDYLTIPGANLQTLTAAFRAEYSARPLEKPLDVVLVAGYVDISEGSRRLEIMTEFISFCEAVFEVAPRNESNTVAISDLMFPPAYTWFPHNGPIPANHSGNRLYLFEWLNEAILSLNLDNWVTEFLRVRKYGIRLYTRRNRDRSGRIEQERIRQHRFDHWQGQDVCSKVLLVNEQRFKLGAALNKYFYLRTRW